MGKLENLGVTPPSKQEAPPSLRVVISVGLPKMDALNLAGALPVVELQPDQLTRSELAQHDIVMVCCALWSKTIDALDIGAALTSAGYTGVLVVLAPTLPNKTMVLKELRKAARGLQIRLVCR